MSIEYNDVEEITIYQINVRCPHCGKLATFSDIKSYRIKKKSIYFGINYCPNTVCRKIVFYISLYSNLTTYPPQQIDFDSKSIPQNILNTFKEAITCHANECYKASAIMVRRTLEEICNDKEAKGNNLKKRLEDLKGKIVIPQQLIILMDELRILGNDAAHIEAKDYQDIGKEELDISIDITKEILKAVYQYDNLVERLSKLKNSHESSE